MFLPDHLGEGGLEPVKEVPVHGGLLPQGDNNREDMRGDLSDGWLHPQIVQHPNNFGGEKACSPCANPAGAVIRLSKGLLKEVVKVVPFPGNTREGGI